MSIEARSGIVYYPDQIEVPLANLARQLGMIVGSAIIEGDGGLRLATAHAVGYDPGIATSISEGRGVAGNAILPPDEGKMEPFLLRELVDTAFEHLRGLELAAEDPAHTFDGRRVDIIVPDVGNIMGFAAAVASLIPRLPGRPTETPHIWTIGGSDERGTFREYTGRGRLSLDPRHPLGSLYDLTSRVSDHRVHTTRATASPAVTEAITVIGPEEVEYTKGLGSFRTTRIRETRDEEIIVDIPPPDDPATLDRLGLLQLDVELGSLGSEILGERGAREDYALQHADDSRGAFRQDRVTDAAATLDPLKNSAWSHRLN